MRSDQSATRSDLKPIELDINNGGILKINPLVEWSESQVIEYAREHSLPTNRLYNMGYRSIGCAPCTRAIGPDDHVREGRWWWENPEHKECGLHRK
jgi:phosphoadenosine phosphosulfate reductase